MVILTDKTIDEKLITTIQRNGRYLLEDGGVYSLHIGDEVIGTAQEVNTDPSIEFRESRFGIVELEHQPFNPILDNFNEFLTMQNNMETAFNKGHKKRKCWVCEKALNYKEYLDRNSDKNIQVSQKRLELEKQWESDIVEIPCCNCFSVLNLLQNKKLSKIMHDIINDKIYDIDNQSFHIEKSYANDVVLYFKDNWTQNISIKIFKNLVEKGFIDVDPSALKELLGGSE